MKKSIANIKLSIFEKIRQTDKNGNGYWMERQLAKVLDYTDFRNLSGVTEKAIEVCKNSGNIVDEHIIEVNEVLVTGQGAKQTYLSFKLSRYACCLIVQNADPTKEVIA